MDRATAEKLASLVREECPHSIQFRIEEERKIPLEGFYSWTNRKDCMGAFLMGVTLTLSRHAARL